MIAWLLNRSNFFWQPRLLWASQLYDFLGRAFLINPKKIGCLSSFYYVQSDRPIPSVEDINRSNVERALIKQDVIRRALTDQTAKAITVFVPVLGAVVLLALSILN